MYTIFNYCQGAYIPIIFVMFIVFYLFKANGSIKAGDVLIVEKPYASILLPDYRHSHCYHCMKLLVAPIP